ncbi:MAG TPA: hypothetical protein ENH47_01930 [Ignavibacteriales bacterium]|nr:hypothetical protein [Ignavibacteriales bacterium]
MNRISIILISLLIVSASHAQSSTDKGNIMLNGTISFASKSYGSEGFNTTQLGIHPQAGYFLFNNFSAGILIDYDRTTLDSYHNNKWAAGIALRYYLDFKQVKPFINLGFAYSKTNPTSNLEGNIYGKKWITAAGVDYFLVSNVAIETILRYEIEYLSFPGSYNVFYKDTNSHTNTLFVGFGLNFFIY